MGRERIEEESFMGSNLCLFLSWGILGISVLATILLRRKKNSFYLLFGGVFAAGFFIHFPLALDVFRMEECSVIKSVLLAFFYALRLFVVEGDYELIAAYIVNVSCPAKTMYSVLSVVLIVLAPILTFGFVLSFFKTVFSYVSFLLHFFSETYVFTELNKKSFLLAKNLKENKKNRMIIFTGITKALEDECDLLEEARAFGAIFLRRSSNAYNFHVHAPKSKVIFVAVGEDESTQIEEAIGLCKKYGERAYTELYVFATEASSELILSSLTPAKMKLR